MAERRHEERTKKEGQMSWALMNAEQPAHCLNRYKMQMVANSNAIFTRKQGEG